MVVDFFIFSYGWIMSLVLVLIEVGKVIYVKEYFYDLMVCQQVGKFQVLDFNMVNDKDDFVCYFGVIYYEYYKVEKE